MMSEDESTVEEESEEIDEYNVLDEDTEEDEEDDEDNEQTFAIEDEPLSDEELDRVADTAIDTLREILTFFDAEDSSIDEYEGEDGEILLDVVGEDLAILIGRHGKTLDALQLLVASATNKKLGFRYPIIIDIEGYKYRRRQKIEGIAHSAASRAAKQNAPVRLRPMTPYERRYVHIALRDDKRVTTASEGDEPNRYVVVKPTRH